MLDKEVYYWSRLPRTFWENSNVLSIEEQEPLCIIFYLKLLSKTLNLDGYCRDEFGKWTIERIKSITNCSSIKKTEEYIKMLTKVKLLDKSNGCLHISNFEDLVGFETYKAKRMREYREKIKEQIQCSNVTTNEPTNEPTNVITNESTIQKEEESNKEVENKINSNNNIYSKKKRKKEDEQDKLDETTTLASDGTLHISNLSSILVDKGLIKPNDAYMLDFNNLFDHYCHDENGKFDIELFQKTKNNIVYIANKLKKSKSQTSIESLFGYFKAAMKDYRKHQDKESARLKEELEAEINSKYSAPVEELTDEESMKELERLRAEYQAKQEAKS